MYYHSNLKRTATLALACVFTLIAISTESQSATIVDLVGDVDNFGYGGTPPNPNAFYDNSGPGDLGIFDLELSSSGDDVQSWTHNFTANPMYGAGFTANSVLIEIPELFSNNNSSSITIDGVTLPFVVNGLSASSGFPVVQTFAFAGAAAAFANDGIVNITFRENGDDIALDYSRLTVNGTLAAIPEPTSMALLGLTVLGYGVSRRRRKRGKPVEEAQVV